MVGWCDAGSLAGVVGSGVVWLPSLPEFHNEWLVGIEMILEREEIIGAGFWGGKNIDTS